MSKKKKKFKKQSHDKLLPAPEGPVEPSTLSGQHGTDTGSVPALAPGLDSSDTAKAIRGTESSVTEMRRYISRQDFSSKAKRGSKLSKATKGGCKSLLFCRTAVLGSLVQHSKAEVNEPEQPSRKQILSLILLLQKNSVTTLSLLTSPC